MKDFRIIMNSRVFLNRIIKNKLYWLSVLAAILLLCCSVIYKDQLTGEEYFFVSVFYDEMIQESLQYGVISLKEILLGDDTSYLWMFCPIIVSVPVVLINKTERFVLFRSSKNNYLFSKYFAGLFCGGSIMLIAYVIFAMACTPLTQELLWDVYLVRKLLSVFVWGVYCSIPSTFLAEVVHNKYLILCIPFVLNYFMCMFLGRLLPWEIRCIISPNSFQRLFVQEDQNCLWNMGWLLTLVVAVAVFKKIIMERRCDCGQ